MAQIQARTKMVMDIAEQIVESRLLVKNTLENITRLETQLQEVLSGGEGGKATRRVRKTRVKRSSVPHQAKVYTKKSGTNYDTVVKFLKESGGEVTRQDILQATGVKANSVQEVLQQGKKKGVIKFVRRGVYKAA